MVIKIVSEVSNVDEAKAVIAATKTPGNLLVEGVDSAVAELIVDALAGVASQAQPAAQLAGEPGHPSAGAQGQQIG